jgi:hypothetical protein
MQVARALGVATGALMTPFMLPFILARRARLFHPTGELHVARVVPPSGVLPGAPATVAARLAGPALVRFSGGLFSRSDLRDSLGVALRFNSQPIPSAVYAEGDQDLVLVTLRSFLLPRILAGFRQTNAGDYLDNTYWGIWPYEVEGFGRVSLRLTASGAGLPGTNRAERLLAATENGTARLLLELAPLGSDIYLPVAELQLGKRLSVRMQEAFSLNPSSSGRGLRPSGFLHGLRVVPYKASQFARRHIRPRLPRPERAADTLALPARLALPGAVPPPSFIKRGGQPPSRIA